MGSTTFRDTEGRLRNEKSNPLLMDLPTFGLVEILLVLSPRTCELDSRKVAGVGIIQRVLYQEKTTVFVLSGNYSGNDFWQWLTILRGNAFSDVHCQLKIDVVVEWGVAVVQVFVVSTLQATSTTAFSVGDQAIEQSIEALNASKDTRSVQPDQTGEAGTSEGMLRRLETVESSIGALAHSVHRQQADNVERLRTIDTLIAEFPSSPKIPSWLENVPSRFASLEAVVAALSPTAKIYTDRVSLQTQTVESLLSTGAVRGETRGNSVARQLHDFEGEGHQHVEDVEERLQAIEVSIAALAQFEQADWLETMFQRFQSLETSIAALTRSVQTQSPEDLFDTVQSVESLVAGIGSNTELLSPKALTARLLTIATTPNDAVVERLRSVEESLSGLVKDQESDLLDTVMQRFQVVESSIATLAHSVQQQRADDADHRQSRDTPRTELFLPAQMPSWFESVPDRLAALEAAAAANAAAAASDELEHQRRDSAPDMDADFCPKA